MKSKFTRRTMLGVVIGCLAAGPFVIRALRRTRPINYIADGPYNRFTISPKIIDSSISKEELEKAFEAFFSERDKWLSVRSITGNISVTTEGSNSPKGTSSPICQGYIQLNLLNVLYDGNKQQIPFTTELTFSTSKNEVPLFHFFSDRKNNKKELKGNQNPCFDPALVSQILTSAPEIFAGAPNTTFQDLITGYLSVDKIDNNTYIFKSNKKLTDDGCLSPEFEFTNGYFSKFVSKRYPNKPYSILSFESVVNSNGFLYPCTQRLSIKRPNTEVENTQTLHTTIELADVQISMS